MAKKPDTAPSAKSGVVKARVIAACALGKINDVVEIDEARAAALVGEIDTHPDAVAYAENLKG